MNLTRKLLGENPKVEAILSFGEFQNPLTICENFMFLQITVFHWLVAREWNKMCLSIWYFRLLPNVFTFGFI